MTVPTRDGYKTYYIFAPLKNAGTKKASRMKGGFFVGWIKSLLVPYATRSTTSGAGLGRLGARR